MTLIHPGDTSELESVNGILRSIREDERAGRLADIERRKANGAALDDDTRWPVVLEMLKRATAFATEHDTPQLRRTMLEVLDSTGSYIADPGPYEEDPRLVGIEVKLVILQARRMRKLSSAEHRALERQRSCMTKLLANPEDEAVKVALEDAAEAVIAARRALISEVLVGLRVNGAEKEPAAELDALDRTGLVFPLYVACAAFQDLPWGKEGRSGSQVQATSSASTAAPVPSTSTSPAAATAAA